MIRQAAAGWNQDETGLDTDRSYNNGLDQPRMADVPAKANNDEDTARHRAATVARTAFART